MPPEVVRYRPLLESLMVAPPVFAATRESATAVQVERGAALADALVGRAVEPLPAVRPDVVDAAGHRRPMYRPLLVYAHLLAGGVTAKDSRGVPRGPPLAVSQTATLWTAKPQAAEPYRDALPSWVASLALDGDAVFTAVEGGRAAAAVWSALALHVGGLDGGRAPGLFRRLAAAQQPGGALLRATASDNPELHWFHELVVLHAAADFALRTGDEAVWAAVERATLFHLNETEPDHASGQPWGLPAFVRVPGAAPMVDALLHAVSAHQPGGASGVPLLLLADTVYGLRDADQRTRR